MRRFIKYLFLVSAILFSEEDVEKNIQKILPSGFEINFIEESELPNFYAVNVLNNQIIYVSHDYKFVFAGDLIGIRDDGVVSINNKYKTMFTQKIVSTIKPEESIDFVAKNEKHRIKVFTDISCAYCRLFHSEIEKYLDEGITVQYLGFPRDGLESEVFNNMQSAWCSNNRKESLTKLKLGEEIKKELCQNPIKEHFRIGSLIGITGTPTIVLNDGRKFSGYIPAKELIELIDNG
ncbi:MAG: hypothetical protein CMD63_02825 [Gammaproteobacteria bacterium]|nr:hypothetical protein [Gammaproteobacteria bacterium]